MPGTLSQKYLLTELAHGKRRQRRLHYFLLAALIGTVTLATTLKHGNDASASSGSPSSDSAEVLLPEVGPSSPQDAATLVNNGLEMPMRAALEHVARRYRVSAQALVPIFETAIEAGRERNLDPILLIAIIGIESRFNPYSQSIVGAQGLMQIIPRFYQDKIPKGAPDNPFLDPVLNVRVGAQILQEIIQRQGSLVAGLQVYGGATNDDSQTYATKVLAEKRMLEQVTRRAVNPGT